MRSDTRVWGSRLRQKGGAGRRIMWLWLAIAWLTCWPGLADSQGLLASFDAANRLYEAGKYSEAATAYETLLQQRYRSAALYYNLGNAYFKSGETGRAIAAYRLAQRLAPRDPDIRANLRFARDTVGAAKGRQSWQWLLNVLSLEELTLLTAAAVWGCITLSVCMQLRRSWAPALRPYRNLAGALAVCTLAWLGVMAEDRLGRSAAVVIVEKGVLRYGPFEEAQTFLTLRDGAELRVLNRKDSWLQVANGANRVGWVQSKDVLVLPQG